MTEVAESVSTERSKVEWWRLHILTEAGYDPVLALEVATSEADLHLAVDLVRDGCSPDVAAQILL